MISASDATVQRHSYGRVSGTVIARNMYGSASETIMATTISMPPKACCADIGSRSQKTLSNAAVTGSIQNNTAASAGPSCVCARDCPQKANTVEPSARNIIGPTTVALVNSCGTS